MRVEAAMLGIPTHLRLLGCIVASALGLSALGCTAARPYEVCHGQVAAPPGAATYERAMAQSAVADQANFVLFAHHWYQGGSHLGPDGEDRLSAIVHRLQASPPPMPVIIESQPIIIRPDPREFALSSDEAYLQTVAAARELNETRRMKIVAALHEAGVPDAEDLVLVDRVPQGLYGVEAPLASQQLVTGGMMMGRGMGMRGGMGMGGMGMRGGMGMGGMGMGGMGMGGMGMGGMGMGMGGMGMSGMGMGGFGGFGGGRIR